MKKIQETTRIERNKETSTEIKKDSVHSVIEVLPSLSSFSLNASDFALKGDFEQVVSSGEGNQTTIKKTGDKVTITSKNSGSKKTNTKTNAEQKTTIYDSEYVVEEISKTIKRTPFKYKVLIVLLLILWQRKLITQLLVSLIPGLSTKRIVKLFLGKSLQE